MFARLPSCSSSRGPGASSIGRDGDSPAFHEIIGEAIAAGDPHEAAAGERWVEAQIVMEAEMPYIWVTAVDPLLASSADVTGFSQQSDNAIYHHQLKPAG